MTRWAPLLILVVAALFLSGCAGGVVDNVPLLITPDISLIAYRGGLGVALLQEAAAWWSPLAQVKLIASGGTPVRLTRDKWSHGGALATGSSTVIDLDQRYFDYVESLERTVPTTSLPVVRSMLVNLMAHEIGHALGLQHVEDSKAIMYPVVHANMQGLTNSDVDEFLRVHQAPTTARSATD